MLRVAIISYLYFIIIIIFFFLIKQQNTYLTKDFAELTDCKFWEEYIKGRPYFCTSCEFTFLQSPLLDLLILWKDS